MEKRLIPALVLMAAVAACSDGSKIPPVDICNDQAWDQCAHVAKEECGLSARASESKLDRCKPFVQCDNAVFDRCMEKEQ